MDTNPANVCVEMCRNLNELSAPCVFIDDCTPTQPNNATRKAKIIKKRPDNNDNSI